jgi:hypothetical protein
MAEIVVSTQRVSRSGMTPAYTGSLATENIYKVVNNGQTLLHIKKSGAGDCVATIAIQRKVDGQDVDPRTVTVVETIGDRFIGPFPTDLFNDGGGCLHVTFSEITGLTFAAIAI